MWRLFEPPLLFLLGLYFVSPEGGTTFFYKKKHCSDLFCPTTANALKFRKFDIYGVMFFLSVFQSAFLQKRDKKDGDTKILKQASNEKSIAVANIFVVSF